MQVARHILSFPEYASLRHATPYVVDVDRDDARLLVFGSQHSSDPNDPMFDQIEQAFAQLTPLFALYEGTQPALEADREIAIRRHGEAGLIRYLAAHAGIDTASMDIPLAQEAALLRRALPVGDALVFLVVRQLASFNRKTARMDFDAYFGEFFELIAPPLGIPTIEWVRIDAEHRRLLGRPLQPRQVTGTETNPMRAELPTQRIARVSNRWRDEHMLGRLLDALATHRRVFATVGVTHAVMLEPALRAGVDHQRMR